MKLKTLSLLVAGLILTGTASAEYYTGAGYGVSWNGGHAWTDGRKYDYETFSGIFSAFLGTVIPTEWLDLKAEGEFLRLSAKPDAGKTRDFKALMGNIIGVVPNVDMPLKPYVGLGLGYARWDHNNTVAYQVLGGVEYDLDQYPVGFALEYKHLWPNEAGGKTFTKSRINSDSLMLKVKYLF